MQAGSAETIITPLPGAPTLGTIQRSTGIHDELHARALVLNDGQQRVAVVSLDLIGTDFALADEIREAIGKATGITTTFIHCTHNHSAPFTIPWSVLGVRWIEGPGKIWREVWCRDWQNWSLTPRQEVKMSFYAPAVRRCTLVRIVGCSLIKVL